MKLASLNERERAAFGPRALKKPGSIEWCWQTLDGLKADYKRIEERFHDVDGTVKELEHFEAWKIVPPDKPYGSLNAMLKAEIGITQRKLGDQVRILKERGRPKKGEEKGVDNTINRSSTGREYILGRLDRDGFPELAAKVRAHKMSARAAALAAGIPYPKRHCPNCGHEW